MCTMALPLTRDHTVGHAEDLPAVTAVLHYLAPMVGRLVSYADDPPDGVPRTNGVFEGREVLVHDARPVARDLSLDREGFALVRHASAVVDFHDEDELRRVYYPEAERLVGQAVGASRVVVFDHTIRRRVWDVEDRTAGAPRQPVPRVHNDYTVKSGPQRVRDLMGGEADELLKGRFAIINVWRPIRGPLLDAPLAIADARSVAFRDFVPNDLVFRHRVGETYAVSYNPAHRWYYAPAMQRDEALLIKCYDSVEVGVARFAPHTAFDDPTTPPDAPPRESIELRTLAFFG
jgi:hypothetical protein